MEGQSGKAKRREKTMHREPLFCLLTKPVKRLESPNHPDSCLRRNELERPGLVRHSRENRNPRFVVVSLLILLVTFTGCMLGPNYQRPEVKTPQTWRFEDREAKDLANTAWWEQFQDPVLNELIQIALRENKDLLIAAARVEEYMGRYGVTRSSLFPQVGAGATGGRQRSSQVDGATQLPDSLNTSLDFYQAAISATWELDIWGRIRRLSEAARADLLSTEEARRAVVLSLVSSVANAYVNLRDLDKQLEIAKQTAKTREDSYKLFQLRFKGGVISEVQLSQVKSEYEAALATIPQIEKSIGLQENALSILLGRDPGLIPRGRTIDALALPAVPAGLPSELLERRPDIRQEEQDLIAANAQIGAAKALYFPTISLTGLLGTSSSSLSDLFSGPSKVWSYAVPISMPIFTAGAIEGRVRAAEAVQQQALIRYQKTIQTGFREVDDALIDQNRTREQLRAQLRQIEALRSYVRLARLRYDNGYTSYLEVLDAERSLFNVELTYTQVQGGLFFSLVNLYKAMGGGWVVEADRMTGYVSASGEGKE
jgi:outer membrane protein, multidrug efflux system